MVELYFLLFRIPWMMTRAARQRKRSALAWSMIGIAAWVCAQFAVIVLVAIIYGLIAIFLDWPQRIPIGLRLVSYLLSLGAAIISVTLVRRYLVSTSQHRSFPTPPPPPRF
jgi:hypothetical protein